MVFTPACIRASLRIDIQGRFFPSLFCKNEPFALRIRLYMKPVFISKQEGGSVEAFEEQVEEIYSQVDRYCEVPAEWV